MRCIDADALMKDVREHSESYWADDFAEYWVNRQPTIEPERKKDTIQKFHDYQVEWLLSHCDLELEPQLEEWVVRFLHDTANCYMMEIDREEGE